MPLEGSHLPAFTYTGGDERYYPSLSVTVTPGLTVELDEMPNDGRWRPVEIQASEASDFHPTNLGI